MATRFCMTILIMAKEMKLAPVVEVKKNETVKIEWKVKGR